MMNVENMTDLIRIYDAYRRLDKVSESITGGLVPTEGSILLELSAIEGLIMRNSTVCPDDDPNVDFYDTKYSQILNNTALTAKERAMMLLGER